MDGPTDGQTNGWTDGPWTARVDYIGPLQINQGPKLNVDITFLSSALSKIKRNALLVYTWNQF